MFARADLEAVNDATNDVDLTFLIPMSAAQLRRTIALASGLLSYHQGESASESLRRIANALEEVGMSGRRRMSPAPQVQVTSVPPPAPPVRAKPSDAAHLEAIRGANSGRCFPVLALSSDARG